MTIPSSSSSSRLHAPSLSELKQLKNRIIGTPSAKCRLAQDQGMMKTLVWTVMDGTAGDDIRTETAQILGSLASLGGHTDDGSILTALIEQDALRSCLSALSTTKQVKLRLALVRASSIIASDLAEIVGPPLWGLCTFESRWLVGAAAQTLEWFFGSEAMDIWVPMLSSAEAGVVSNMIGTIVRTQPVRDRLCAWRNATERERKERRGWEATRTAATGGYALRTLLELLERKETVGSALFALAALAKDNPTLANELPLQNIVGHAKSRSSDIQLSACLCATFILRASPAAAPAADAVLSVLVTTITNNTIYSAKAAFILAHLLTDSPVYSQLAFDRGTLRILLTTLRRLTPSCPSLPQLPPFKEISLTLFTGPEWESWLELELDQPKADIRLREAVLLSLASISLFSNDIRRALAEDEGDASIATSESPSSPSSQSALSLILSALISPHTSLRCAACHVVRTLTRSVAVIRTNIVDSGLGWLLLALFMGWSNARPRTALGDQSNEEEDPRVLAAALRAVCNAVCEFSPLKPLYIDQGLVSRLAEFIHPSVSELDYDGDSEDSLRFNSLWAIKNLVRKSILSMKQEVIRVLEWRKVETTSDKRRSRLDDLLSSPSPKILEQTLNILRNLSEDEDGIHLVINELDIQSPSPASIPVSASPSGLPLLSHLTSVFTQPSHSLPSSADILVQSASLLANLTNSPDLKHHRMILTCPGMVPALRRILAEQGPDVRRPVVRAVLELIKADFGVVEGVGGSGDAGGDGGSDVDREGDEDTDIDIMGIGYGIGMGRSGTGRSTASIARGGKIQGLTGARKILTDAGFVGTLRRIVDQHHHHPSLIHHAATHPHPHSPVASSGSGVGHMHSHGSVSSSFGSSSSIHHHFGSLGNDGMPGGGVGNAGREDREDLETARSALDWLEHGDVYAYNSYARSASVGIGSTTSATDGSDP